MVVFRASSRLPGTPPDVNLGEGGGNHPQASNPKGLGSNPAQPGLFLRGNSTFRLTFWFLSNDWGQPPPPRPPRAQERLPQPPAALGTDLRKKDFAGFKQPNFGFDSDLSASKLPIEPTC